MIIATKSIDIGELRDACLSSQTLLTYCESLVPKAYQHLHFLLDNQKYYVALRLRKIKSLTYRKKESLLKELLKDVAISGVINDFTDISDIFDEVNVEKLLILLRSGDNGYRGA
ncbi:MAG: hypothetical protein LBS29_05000 [Endomicrobium sp.]|jgi:hypothetical protein|nr:hypothetical protein [Endomicrobium sp.]